jgi:zinc/manganese transport system substrate-binding protein
MSKSRFHAHRRSRRRADVALAAITLAVLFGIGACSSSNNTTANDRPSTPDQAAPACPVEALEVVVSVDQWSDLVATLAGSCADVTTVIAGTAADPHDYEPTPADSAAVTTADLVVVNGAGYDTWATDAVAAADPSPAVVDAAKVMGVLDGDNPHLWYSPEAVDQVGAAVTTALGDLRPTARDYFAARSGDWSTALAPWRDALDTTRAVANGRPYGATETVFDLQADWLGMTNATPAGFVASSLNETDPSPGDLAAFDQQLSSAAVDVLVVNAQTESAVSDELRRSADAAAVPVVEVTESIPPGAAGFVDWQVGQLRALREALSS